MRRLLLAAVATLFVIGCSSATEPTPPPAPLARILFRLDAATCRTPKGPVQMDFYIDATLAGITKMSPGDTVSYPAAPGPHDIHVMVGVTRLWDAQRTVVGTNQEYVTLACVETL